MDMLDNNFREINTITARLTANSNIRYIATQMDEEDKKIEISKIQYRERGCRILWIGSKTWQHGLLSLPQ